MSCYIIVVFLAMSSWQMTCASFNKKTDIGRRCILKDRTHEIVKVKDTYAVTKIKSKNRCKAVMKARR